VPQAGAARAREDETLAMLVWKMQPALPPPKEEA
jgi:hypothetical protein